MALTESFALWCVFGAGFGIAYSLILVGMSQYIKQNINVTKRGRFGTFVMATRRVGFIVGPLYAGIEILLYNLKFLTKKLFCEIA